MPSQEKTGPSPDDKFEVVRKTVKEKFDNFLALSDEPGEYISPEEKFKLIEESNTNPEAKKRLEENRQSKYRGNSLSLGLDWGDFFLENAGEMKKIPINKVEGLKEKLKKAREMYKEIRGVRFSQNEKERLMKTIAGLQITQEGKEKVMQEFETLSRGAVTGVDLENLLLPMRNKGLNLQELLLIKENISPLIEGKFEKPQLITKEVVDAVVNAIKNIYPYLK